MNRTSVIKIYAQKTDRLVIRALRCWRAARDLNEPAMPRLAMLLRRETDAMLAPCFASLMALAELHLGRRLRAGNGRAQSPDERLIVGLVTEMPPLSLASKGDVAKARLFMGAVQSARALLAHSALS